MRGVTRASLIQLRETLSAGREDGRLSLSDFGRLLGRAVNRYPYSRSYVSKLLSGAEPISPKVARAARVLMVGVAALEEKGWVAPLPTFEGRPIEKLKEARVLGVGWRDLYASDADVRVFIDTLVDVIARG